LAIERGDLAPLVAVDLQHLVVAHAITDPA